MRLYALLLAVLLSLLSVAATLRQWSHKAGAKERLSSSVKRELVLFNDLIIVADVKGDKLTERALIPVRSVLVWDVTDEKAWFLPCRPVVR